MVQRICVIGAGVVGLSCAVRLKEVLGVTCDVTVIAHRFDKETTSNVAAGAFRFENIPSVSGYNGKRKTVGRDVACLSYERYQTLLGSTEAEKVGVHRLRGYTISYPGVVEPGKVPFYLELCENWHELSSAELASKFPALPDGCSGFVSKILLVSPKTYLPWLMQRFLQMGGRCKKAQVHTFEELWDEYDIIMNCTGLGSRDLTGDTTIIPSRGQVMRADLPEAKNTFAYINNGTEHMPYYFWTPHHTVLGGTKRVGNGDTTISQKEHKMVLETCKTHFPFLNITEEKIVDDEVGLRPSRPAVRIEKEEHHHNGNKKWVIHNYGHCSNGIALSWGTAHVAVEMVTDLIHPNSKL